MKRIAARMILEGKDDETVMRETGLTLFDITGVKGWLKKLRKRGINPMEWVEGKVIKPENLHSIKPLTDLEKVSEPVAAEKTIRTGTGLKEAQFEPVPSPASPRGSEALPSPVPRLPRQALAKERVIPLTPEEVVIEVEGIPVGRKIRLSPKNLMFYDWFKTKYGYEGDLSQFINDAIEDFFRSRNWVIKVVKEERID